MKRKAYYKIYIILYIHKHIWIIRNVIYIYKRDPPWAYKLYMTLEQIIPMLNTRNPFVRDFYMEMPAFRLNNVSWLHRRLGVFSDKISASFKCRNV